MRRSLLLIAIVFAAIAFAPATTLAQEGPARLEPASHVAVQLPDGELHVADATLDAGSPEPIRIAVALDRPPSGASLEVTLPPPFDQQSPTGLPYTGPPRLVDSASGRITLRRAGRALTVRLGSARANDTATVEIPDVGLPAGSYDLQLQWHRADGTSTHAGTAHLVVRAGTKDGDSSPIFGRLVAPLDGSVVDSSHDAVEESETFVTVTPGDPSRIATAANNMADGRRGVWLSTNGGQSFAGLALPTTLRVQGSPSEEVNADLCCDPILASSSLGDIWVGGLSLCTGNASAATTRSRIYVARIPAGSSSFTSTGVGLPLRNTSSTCADPRNDVALQDKPQMTIDNTVGSPTRGRLYVTWDNPVPDPVHPDQVAGVNVVVSMCDTVVGTTNDPARCDDAGNWTTPARVSGATQGSFINSDPAVAPNGTVSVVWWDYSSNNGIRTSSCPAATADCSNESSWTTPQTLVSLTKSSTNAPIPFACPIVAQPGGRPSPVPSLTFDTSGTSPTGRAYLAWSDLRAGTGTTRCTQAGVSANEQTWDSYVATASSLSTLLAAPDKSSTALGQSVMADMGTGSSSASNSDDWFPWIALDASSGQGWVTLYSTFGDAGRRLTNAFLASVDPPNSGTAALIASPQKVSPDASDYGQITASNRCCTFRNDYGDYTGLAATNGFAYPVWTQHRCAADDGDVLVLVPHLASPPASSPSPCGSASPLPSAPPIATPAPPSAVPAPPPPLTGPTKPPAVLPHVGLRTTILRQRLSTVLRKRMLTVRGGCVGRCKLTFTLLLPPRAGSRAPTITLGRLTFTGTGVKTLHLKPSRSAVSRLRASHRRKLILKVVASAAGRTTQRKSLPFTLAR